VEEAAARRGAAGGRGPFVVRCRVVIPGRLFVKAEKPAMNLELEGDATLEATGGAIEVEGVVEAVRGTVEPIAGRVFHVERAKVTFPGGAVMAGRIDAVARYDHPKAVVKVTVGDTLAKPSLALSSEPAMDDASIAMLIATGETQLELNTSGVSTLDTQAATQAVASAALTAAFTGLVSDRLPVDQVSVDSTRVRAGKYVTDELFVGYAYYFAAKPEEGENVNEVKAEYRIGQRWRFELRYGDAQAGDAMLIWKKDY
jgi:translocation and assembly module TamB